MTSKQTLADWLAQGNQITVVEPQRHISVARIFAIVAESGPAETKAAPCQACLKLRQRSRVRRFCSRECYKEHRRKA